MQHGSQPIWLSSKQLDSVWCDSELGRFCRGQNWGGWILCKGYLRCERMLLGFPHRISLAKQGVLGALPFGCHSPTLFFKTKWGICSCLCRLCPWVDLPRAPSSWEALYFLSQHQDIWQYNDITNLHFKGIFLGRRESAGASRRWLLSPVIRSSYLAQGRDSASRWITGQCQPFSGGRSHRACGWIKYCMWAVRNQ